ncbi:MAG: DUF2252 family protein, partial [Gemmatimonadetes bacterium]|nr:DUF2252 family protein [Gemmatimonadota bacterium]
MTDPLRALVQHDRGRDPALLARKHDRMRASAFAFLRGSCRRFYDLLPPGPGREPQVWGCGDLHLENFGSYKGDNRLTYFDVNDFDDAARFPATAELVRMVASILLAADELALPPKDGVGLARHFLEAHRNALIDGHARWVERDCATGIVRALLEQSRLRTRKALLAKRTVGRGTGRRILIDNERQLAVPVEVRRRVTRALQHVLDEDPTWGGVKVLDVAHRVAGIGSLGVERYIALVKPLTTNKATLLDLKEVEPADAVIKGERRPRFESEVERVITLQKRLQAVPPALLRPVMIGQVGFVLKELQPSADRVELAAWRDQPAQMDGLMTTLADVVAWARLRASGRGGADIAD